MIRYTLKCHRGHSFDSWFQSADAFDQLNAAGLVCCTVCDSGTVSKAIMAPRVSLARTAASPDAAPAPGPAQPPQANAAGDACPAETEAKPKVSLRAPASEIERKFAELRARIEASSEDVGPEFAREARAIHAGDAPARPIIGEVRPKEARSLIEDGIPVTPLPWGGRKTN